MTTPCVEWAACRDKDGYGIRRFDGRKQPAHRVAWQLAHGAIPAGLFVLHSCDNPPCVNVRHLRLGTHLDNMRERDAKGRQPKGDTHGLRLHPEAVLRGERNGKAKLTDAQANEIRTRITGRYGELRRLAAEFGVSVSLVEKIKAGQRRKALT